MVHIHPIMIGVTGTIYKEFYDTMDLLGVSKAEAKRCAAVMHNIAVSYVDIITTTKWQQERRGWDSRLRCRLNTACISTLR